MYSEAGIGSRRLGGCCTRLSTAAAGCPHTFSNTHGRKLASRRPVARAALVSRRVSAQSHGCYETGEAHIMHVVVRPLRVAACTHRNASLKRATPLLPAVERSVVAAVQALRSEQARRRWWRTTAAAPQVTAAHALALVRAGHRRADRHALRTCGVGDQCSGNQGARLRGLGISPSALCRSDSDARSACTISKAETQRCRSPSASQTRRRVALAPPRRLGVHVRQRNHAQDVPRYARTEHLPAGLLESLLPGAARLMPA